MSRRFGQNEGKHCNCSQESNPAEAATGLPTANPIPNAVATIAVTTATACRSGVRQSSNCAVPASEAPHRSAILAAASNGMRKAGLIKLAMFWIVLPGAMLPVVARMS